jgi:formylglycine-generating enzyme required for sulfatase activity
MNSRADLLRTLIESERALGRDPDLSARLADTLGYESFEEPAQPGGKEEGGGPVGNQDKQAGPLYSAWRPTTAWTVIACEALPKEPNADEAPYLPLPEVPERTPHQRTFLPAPVLRNPGQWQNLWDRIIIGRESGRRIDLKRCLRDLSQARPINRLPLLEQRHFNGPITVIIDRPAQLRQAHGDMLAAWRSLLALVGRQGLSGFQLRRGPEGDWECLDEHLSIASEQAIKPASQILLLGAFGALETGHLRADWRALIARLKGRGHPLHLLPVCHLHASPVAYTPLDPRHAGQSEAGAQEIIQALLVALARCWKVGEEQLRYLRHALSGAGLHHELKVANHRAVNDRHSHIELDLDDWVDALRAFDRLPEARRRELSAALEQWRESRNERAREMERLQAGLLNAPSLAEFPRLTAHLGAIGRQEEGAEEIPIGLADYLPLLERLSKQQHGPEWNEAFRLARRVARILGEPLPGGYHPEELPETDSPPARWLRQNGTRLEVSSRPQRALLPLGEYPYVPGTGRIIRRSIPTGGNEIEIMDRGWRYRLQRQGCPAWAERFWQDDAGVIHLAHPEGGVFALIPAAPERPKARWRCLHNPWPWAADLGVDDYGLWVEIRLGGIGQRLRWIPPGQFEMGSPADEPERFDEEVQHTVTLSRGYWLADTACTQALWQAVTGENPAYFKDSAQNPVEQISWDDCQAFLRQANAQLGGELELRLPSEAEWEYACRAGSQGPFSWGEGLTTDQANYDGNSPYNEGPEGAYRERTLEVLSFEPNAWGLYQMHGNVYEWCNDWLGSYPEGAVTDPRGPEKGHERVLRGGSWFDLGRSLRSAFRYASAPDERFHFIGVRLAGG